MIKSAETLIPDPRWFEAPRERTPQFFITFAKVSIALQQALRQLAPLHFFADVNRYKDQRATFAMLAYASSRPFCPKSRTDFTYDVTNPAMMKSFFRLSRRKMIAGLTETQARLMQAGHDDIARIYDPRDARHILKMVTKQRRFRKPLHRLLLAEGKLLNDLAIFSGLQDCSPKDRLREGAKIVKKWRATLAHLCLGSDLSGIAPELFAAVTAAYLATIKPDILDEQWPPIEIEEQEDDLLDWAA